MSFTPSNDQLDFLQIRSGNLLIWWSCSGASIVSRPCLKRTPYTTYWDASIVLTYSSRLECSYIFFSPLEILFFHFFSSFMQNPQDLIVTLLQFHSSKYFAFVVSVFICSNLFVIRYSCSCNLCWDFQGSCQIKHFLFSSSQPMRYLLLILVKVN